MPTRMRWGAPPRGGGGGGGSYRVLGVFIARPIAWLIAAVIFMSACGSVFERMGIAMLSRSVLIVDAVWRGEVWRLMTWGLVELNALGLIFGCLLLYFIGPDLLHRWGTRRFFATYFGGAAVVGALTSLIGRASEVRREEATRPPAVEQIGADEVEEQASEDEAQGVELDGSPGH